MDRLISDAPGDNNGKLETTLPADEAAPGNGAPPRNDVIGEDLGDRARREAGADPAAADPDNDGMLSPALFPLAD